MKIKFHFCLFAYNLYRTELLNYFSNPVHSFLSQVPLSSCNRQFEYLYAHKPRIVLINKIDLANETVTRVSWYDCGFTL